MRVLVVTNDFPPRPGGIQAFVHNFASRLPAEDVVVYAPAWKGAEAFDAAQNFQVVRHGTSLMLPTVGVLNRAREIARAERCDALWFGAAAPLGLLGGRLRASTDIERVVASTHGHEVGWAALPGARQTLRQIGATTDVVTYLGDYTRGRIGPAFGPRPRLERLPSGVDAELFRPGVGRDEIRARHGLTGRRVVVCVSRLVPRKGQDMLIRALPRWRRRYPDTALLLVGGGPYRSDLGRLAREHDVADHVVFTGSVPWEELPAHYAAGDIFAMPCRSRLAGLEVEGLGIVYLEASATGLPVVAGDSGGAPDAVLDGRTGLVVDGRQLDDIADAVAGLLDDPARCRSMGAAGRAWVELTWRWDLLTKGLVELLTPTPEAG
ncbi:glycosyltransferase family 4 protein [Pseudofrankia inefficax]|uniref:Glycosyl transferase group 1 n=1 Tax=Pseudofrankia inefficax (strain DSM 45817 / CECT 9037 / DDB 130130 / EuI1c) TaxID=298654 RepID=E3JBJ1_PSEI1|nr:glycosyltransferase family 4 protein [Pseudofrankia inefficax]ADP79863.1 glycosyl transferase group 1 [Pseudofrankia inefficax]